MEKDRSLFGMIRNPQKAKPKSNKMFVHVFKIQKFMLKLSQIPTHFIFLSMFLSLLYLST